MMKRYAVAMTLAVGAWLLAVGQYEMRAAEVGLLDARSRTLGWTFNNGQEFPGATGSLGRETGEGTCLKLEGNFSKGGNYVEANTPLDDVEIDELSFRIKYPGAEQVTIRVGDSGGQCHQINLKLKSSPDWQQVRFALADFLARKGASPAAEQVARYENWGGANDARWHGPAKYMALLIGPGKDRGKPVSLLLKDAKAISAAAVTTAKASVRLDDFADDEVDWTFFNGQEFPGATGALALTKDGYAPGRSSLRIAGDFTKGGMYVTGIKDLSGLGVTALRLKVMSTNLASFTVRMIDSTGQCHQKHGYRIKPDGQWQDVIVRASEFAGVEHWGGANDGKWHGPASAVSILIGPSESTKTPVLNLADISADTEVPASIQAATFSEGFESEGAFPAAWSLQGAVSRDRATPFKGKGALQLDRAKEDMERKTTEAVFNAFPVKPGLWELAVAMKGRLYSPDSSYNGMTSVEILDESGRVLNTVELGLVRADLPWKLFKTRAEFPVGAAKARFVVRMNKTFGSFAVDELSAAYVAPSAKANARVSRIKFASQALGNLFYPGSNVCFEVVVECVKPLPEEGRKAVCVMRDYWGAEQSPFITVKLDKMTRAGRGKRQYSGTLDLSGQRIELGKYYEIHAEVAEPEAPAPSTDKSAFAVLPQAVTKAYKPFDIPFTSRNWDNRIKEYFFLSDRLGIRVCGLWSGWSSKPPYKPNAPGIEWCEQLGMGAVLGAPNWQNGTNEFSETALREGAKAMVTAYKDRVPIMVTLGNEPHPATDERCREMIASYRAVYEGVKSVDSNILCIGTSCGPDEIFFKNGFQPWQDVYDFHTYDSPAGVTASFEAYRRFFEKYPGSAKPIWATEIGLNSQGMTRRVITIDLIKKFSLFFAAGGVNMSWFDLLYPDPEGKRPGSNSESFDVFDSRYCLYAPKMDAIAYYNMVNGICIKRFVERRDYAGDIPAFLFRDRDHHCLLVMWKEKGRRDIFLPLSGVGPVTVIRLDGSQARLDAHQKGLTLGVSEEPLLLLFDAAALTLPADLAAPAFMVDGVVEPAVKGAASRLAIRCDGAKTSRLVAQAPLGWETTRASTAAGVLFNITPPAVTAAREGRIVVRAEDGSGELWLAMPVCDPVSARVVPSPFKNGVAGLTFTVSNNGGEQVHVDWSVSVPETMAMEGGQFKLGDPASFTPVFTGPSEGSITVAPRSEDSVTVGLSNLNPLNLYNEKLELRVNGKTMGFERALGGFVGVPKVTKAVVFDGKLGDPAWERAAVLNVNEKGQVFAFGTPGWTGPADLSGKLRFLWDDEFLYLGADVTDDVFRNIHADGDIWNGDGLQMLADPCRDVTEKPGKYEYTFAAGTKGPQVMCNSSADSGAPAGEARDVKIRVTPSGSGGNRIYEIAIPWKRLAPAKPRVGTNLGMAVIINEDDGPGREGFMAWFGCPHSKQLGMNGDLILTEQGKPGTAAK